MKKHLQYGDIVKVGKTNRKAVIMEVNGAVTQVKYNDGRIAVVPTRWIKD